MEKKALQLASVASMIDQFNIPNIRILQSLGYKVDVIADFTNPGTISAERAENLKNRLNEMGVGVFDIPIPRSLQPSSIFCAYKEVREIISREHYGLIHCHSPIGGVICRMAARKERALGTKVIYTAHGFHFYKGAPLLNWLVYYPIEKHYSRFTDVLITINKEDFKRAELKLHAKNTLYIPGVGIDTEKFSPKTPKQVSIRKELGLREDKSLLLSVGELNENKNHAAVIKAIKGMDLVYVVVGKGEKKAELEELAKEYGVDLRLMGFRNDVADFYAAADAYVLPSYREGLNVSLMEAMASGLAVCASRIRGNVDLFPGPFFDPGDIVGISRAITEVLANKKTLGIENLERIKLFDIHNVSELMKRVYTEY